jgi:hypothetical protein
MHVQVVGMAVLQVCSTEALGELKRDGRVQAWGQKTLRAIELKISKEQTWGSVSLRKEVLKKALEARL